MALSFNDLFLKIKKNSVPPVISGAKVLIQRLAEEETKIKNLNNKTASNPINYIKEDMSEIIRKHAVKDYKKDLYIFIKQTEFLD